MSILGGYAGVPTQGTCKVLLPVGAVLDVILPVSPNQTYQVPPGNCFYISLPLAGRNFIFDDCNNNITRTGKIKTQYKTASSNWSTLFETNFDCNGGDPNIPISISEETQFRFVVLSDAAIANAYNWVDGEFLGINIWGSQEGNEPTITIKPTRVLNTAINTPAPNLVTKVCATANAKYNAYPPAGYPIVATYRELTCCKFVGDCKTHYSRYVLEKSSDASTYGYVGENKDYGYLPQQTITQDLTSYRIQFSAPTNCIPGIDQQGAYYHTYTSGELRFFTSAYLYNATIGELANNTISNCSPATTLSVTPPLKSGIANSDLVYTWTLPAGLTFANGTRTLTANGVNSIAVLPIDFGNTNPPPATETVSLSIAWTSPCGRTDVISKNFTINYSINAALPVVNVRFMDANSGEYYNNSNNIYLGTQFCNSKFMYIHSQTLAINNNDVVREWEFSDNFGVISPTLYDLVPTYNNALVNSTDATKAQCIANKRIVAFRPTNAYFAARGTNQTKIIARCRAKSACALTPWGSSNVAIPLSFYLDTAPLPVPTENNNGTVFCVSNNIIFNHNMLLTKNNITWRFYKNNTLLVAGTDYTVVATSAASNVTIKFNNAVFGTAPQPNALDLSAEYTVALVGTCGPKTSSKFNFKVYNSSIQEVDQNAITIDAGSCTRGSDLNNPNTIKFSIPNSMYRNVSWKFFRINNNGNTGAQLSTSNDVALLNAVTNRWEFTTALIEPDGLSTNLTIVAEAELDNVCTKIKIRGTFLEIKNAIFKLPNFTIDSKIFTIGDDPLIRNSHAFSVPVSANYTSVSWSFVYANTNLPYQGGKYSLSKITPNAESVNVAFENITETWLKLKAVATMVSTCGNRTMSKDFILISNPPIAPEVPIILNPRATDQYCQNETINIETTDNPAAIGYTWYVRGSDVSFANAASQSIGTHARNLLNTTALRNTATKKLTLDLSLPLFNKRYLLIQVRDRYSNLISSDYGDFVQVERAFAPIQSTSTISYIDPVFAPNRVKNQGLCLGNNAYFYTNAPAINNAWTWRIDNTNIVTQEPKLKIPVTFAHNGKTVSLETSDPNGCPTTPITSLPITVHNYDAPVLAYQGTNINVPVSYRVFDKPGGTIRNGHATVMYVKNTNTNVTAIDEWKWYEQNNVSNPNNPLNCYVSSTMQIQPVPSAINGGFSKLTTPIDNSIKQLQFSFWAGGSYIPNLTCKYIVMAKKSGFVLNPNTNINEFYECWSDPYIVMTEGVAGTGAFRKEILDETSELGTELVLEPVIYPNPTTGNIQIKLPTESGTLLIYNSLGILVGSYQLNARESSIDLSTFAMGVYTLEIKTNIKTTHTKLIISE